MFLLIPLWSLMQNTGAYSPHSKYFVFIINWLWRWGSTWNITQVIQDWTEYGFYILSRDSKLSLQPASCKTIFRLFHSLTFDNTFYLFPRQEYWSGLPFPSPGDLPDSGLNPSLPHWLAGSLPLLYLRRLSNDYMPVDLLYLTYSKMFISSFQVFFFSGNFHQVFWSTL